MTDTWLEHAACRGADTNLFFPSSGDSSVNAKAVCHTCPVQPECLQYAIDNTIKHGIWGGLTERQRRRIRPKPLPWTGTTHGTPAGYTWHITRHETPCWWCQDIHDRNHHGPDQYIA